jgi:hypothetical protein
MEGEVSRRIKVTYPSTTYQFLINNQLVRLCCPVALSSMKREESAGAVSARVNPACLPYAASCMCSQCLLARHLVSPCTRCFYGP